MNKALVFFCSFILSLAAEANDIDLNELGKSYFAAWTATQMPNASQDDIEHYLSFLADDVGHQHLPYMSDDTRYPTGKDDMRNGMSYYLGAHTEYSATLNEIIPAYGVVVITYTTRSGGIHPQTKELVHQQYDTMEVLEVEDGKVSVIRKYSE